MKKVVIFGLEQFAEMIYKLLREDGREIAAFCLDEAYINGVTEKLGLPVVAFEKLEEYYPSSEYAIIFCIGYTDMNRLREKRIKQARERGYEVLGYCNPTAIIQTEDIGEANIFMEGCVIGQGVKIGEGNIFWPASHVAHHTVVENYNFFTISCAVAGNTKINNYCVFGNNCTVKNRVEIGEGTLVGAGAYIAHSTEPWSVYVPPRSYRLEGKSSLDFKI